MTEFSGSRCLVFQTSTINGESAGSAAPTRAGRRAKPAQSNSPASSGFQRFFGIWVVGRSKPELKMFETGYEPNPEDENNFLNHLPDRGDGVGCPCPMRTGRL